MNPVLTLLEGLGQVQIYSEGTLLLFFISVPLCELVRAIEQVP